MFSEHRFTTCFPTGVWSMMVNGAAALNQSLIPVINDLRSAQPWLANETVDDPGYGQQAQSVANLHNLDQFRDFTRIALGAADQVLAFLKYEYVSSYITDCWANVCRRGENHRAHVHPNNVLSGVYYACAPQGCGHIVFDDPRPQAKVLLPNVTELNPLNSHEFRIEPATGMLIMFPSWLTHRVTVSKSAEERVSISFNVMLRGEIGYEKASARL